jgi:hypothetical protein
MREPPATSATFGLLAEFAEADKLRSAVRVSREAGYRQLDAFSPFPIEGLADAIGFSERRVPVAAMLGGVAGAGLGYGLQAYANITFPIEIGARPLLPWQAFMLIFFELLVLGAVGAAIGAMLVFNRLPRLNHPVFEVPTFRLATSDAFFLAILANDPQFEEAETRSFLERLAPLRVDTIPQAEPPW